MDGYAYEQILKVQRIVNELVGYMDATSDIEKKPSPPPPVFSSPNAWHIGASNGKFTLYVKGGDCPAQMMSDAPATPTNGGDAMKYLTKRSDGRWQGSKVIDGKREFVYARTQAECREKLKNLEKRRKREPKRDSLYAFAKYWLVTYKRGNIADTTYRNY